MLEELCSNTEYAKLVMKVQLDFKPHITVLVYRFSKPFWNPTNEPGTGRGTIDLIIVIDSVARISPADETFEH